MDENSFNYGMGVLDEMDEALRPIGMSVEKLDPSQTQGVPSGLIRLSDGGPGPNIGCCVVLTRKDEVSTAFVQLYRQLTEPCPEKRVELEAYVLGRNGQFLMGTLLLFQDCLCMKYMMALEPSIALEESHVQAAVFAFCQQAEEVGRQGQAICRGTLTAQEALAGNDA